LFKAALDIFLDLKLFEEEEMERVGDNCNAADDADNDVTCCWDDTDTDSAFAFEWLLLMLLLGFACRSPVRGILRGGCPTGCSREEEEAKEGDPFGRLCFE
jgi:hypothetical protein